MKRIITIGREFGAGGGTLGRRLAKELGIEYYDRDIILATAKASAHLTPEQVRQWDERVPKEFGFTQSLFNFYSKPLGEELWNAQVHAIRELADKESCVIVGRNADYILKEYDHCLRVFVHAEPELAAAADAAGDAGYPLGTCWNPTWIRADRRPPAPIARK